MDSSDGEWVDVAGPDDTVRRLWRPDEQPASPDGTFGSWYVDSGDGTDRWEWVSAWRWTEAPPVEQTVPSEPAPAPVEPRLLTRRFVLGWSAAALATAALVVAVDAARGPAPAGIPTAAELAQEIGVSFDRFAYTDDVFDGRNGGLTVTFVNSGRTARTFWTTIEADGVSGPIATETLAVQNLGPGESTTQTAFAANPQIDALAAATFRVTYTDGRPPPL
ncbi:MAG: hypothetical protein ACT4QG_17860 [Sporichthyaceae bacterium]